MEDTQRWLAKAKSVAKHAYCPYSAIFECTCRNSSFAVGAALVCSDGTVFIGCNVETATYTSTCAERTALCAAIAEGHKNFTHVAIVTPTKDIVWPCGQCRQLLLEFCPASFKIHSAPADNIAAVQSCTLGELLPKSFGKDALQEAQQHSRQQGPGAV